jgi:prefoldin subunit 5
MATTTIETDLKEVLAKMDSRLERIEITQSELKESIIKIETTLQTLQIVSEDDITNMFVLARSCRY